jgi:hypothetical protein
MSTTTNNSGGVGFLGVLGIMFIGLKLTDVIDWSWWWVLAPLWGSIALALLIVAYVSLSLFASKGGSQ